MLVGAVDDVVRTSDPARTDALLEELVDAGFRAVGVTSIWSPGSTRPDATELAVLQTVAAGAERKRLRLFLAVYHAGAESTPLTAEARGQFAAYVAAAAAAVPSLRDLIIGNEPNLNRFWMPQFDAAGRDAAAPAYLTLLAETYDAVKAVSAVRIWGGALAPRGIDRPGSGRDTHSPTRFLLDLGAAYRASGRARPVMDGIVLHPYPESSTTPIDRPHPRSKVIGLADYDKLVRLLGEAFDGTAQPGSELPVLYGEVGIETEVPPDKADLYEGMEPAEPASEAAQAAAHRRALELASCQPTVAGLLFFHVRDEPLLAGWQSGVRYADGSPKSSLPAVREAAVAAGDGLLGVRCDS